jgi:hypothetical protein
MSHISLRFPSSSSSSTLSSLTAVMCKSVPINMRMLSIRYGRKRTREHTTEDDDDDDEEVERDQQQQEIILELG